MARATKKRKAKEASEGAETKSGVHFGEDGDPVVTEPIPAEELNALGVQLADLEGKHELLEFEAKEHGKEFRKKLRASRRVISTLSRQMRSGVREVPAQQSLRIGDLPKAPDHVVLNLSVEEQCAKNVEILEAQIFNLNGTAGAPESTALVPADDERAPF